MNKLVQRGFTTVEAVMIIVVILIIAAAGYFTFSQIRDNDENKAATSTQSQADTETEAKEASPPEIKDEAGLDEALKTLDEADIGAGTTADTELGTEASAF